jgi:2-polyprenyl-6-methoxyphenol hydroxylase-like FAD-dependent oxidoreductase
MSTVDPSSSRERFGGGRAVVIGGSMAGLVAARVLSDHFDEVVVVERDSIADGLVEPRKGVPQGRHLHALLARGGQLLEARFPGLRDSAMKDGAVRLDWGRDLAWYHFGGWKVRLPSSSVDILCSSRPFLESQVRRQLFARPNVRRLDRHDVTGVQSTADRSRLTGVTVLARDDHDDDMREGGTTLEADLVVDAGGRGSKALGWLEKLGYAKPPESSVRVQVGYASRIYKMPEPDRFDWRGVYVLGAPPESRRLGAIFPIEGGRVIVVLAGLLGDYAPDDPDGFLRFAGTLPGDAIEPALRAMEPLSDISTYRFPAHRRRHYERVEKLPEGFVVTGDALVSFNPIYGQGMTTACLDAELLDQCLSEQRRKHGVGTIDGLSRRFQAGAARIAAVPWLLATSEDFRFHDVEGQRPPLYPALRWYTEQVHRAARVDPVVHESFLRVMHMLAGPESLFDPRIAWRAIRGARSVPI